MQKVKNNNKNRNTWCLLRLMISEKGRKKLVEKPTKKYLVPIEVEDAQAAANDV